MTHLNDAPKPNSTDYKLALVVGLCALAAYWRTLAPDVLYGDSAEFQTLAYTLGMTHPTGYPVYLLLARLLGLLPLGSLAWRVNFLSAVGASVTLGCVFLLTRYLTRSRAGTLLGSVALGLSYTFWSQAVIAEVYTPGLAFMSLSTLLLWRWQSAPLEHKRALPLAALLTGAGLGVHAFVVLIAPAAVVLVLWTLWEHKASAQQWRRSLGAASLGLALGLGIFLLAFFLVDLNDPPSSFYQVAIHPSRSIWGLETADLDTAWERLKVAVSGLQWQDAMFPGGDFIWESMGYYTDQVLNHEFSFLMLLCAVLGLELTRRALPRLGVFMLLALATMLYLILNYDPPDRYIFYLPTYVLLMAGLGAAAGRVLAHKNRPLHLLLLALLALVVVWPSAAARWQALRDGDATFVRETYVYPIYNLDEPRNTAAWRLEYLPQDAVLILEWRALYTMYYLAHVEGQRRDIKIMEAAPHGSEGLVAETLLQELEQALREGRPVYADHVYGNLRDHFRVTPILGGEWFRLRLEE